MLQNNTAPSRRTDHAAPALCFCVLVLLLIATLVISKFAPGMDSAVALISISCAAQLLPAAIFLIVFRKSKGARVGICEPQKGTFCLFQQRSYPKAQFAIYQVPRLRNLFQFCPVLDISRLFCATRFCRQYLKNWFSEALPFRYTKTLAVDWAPLL